MSPRGGALFPSSLAVIVTGLVLAGGALALFAWAWRRGHFDALDAQSRALFDERDLRLERPWESPAQRRERIAAHGTPEPGAPGEWGGAA